MAFAIILMAYPGFVSWFRSNPRKLHWAYFGLGILPFTLNSWNLDGALVNWSAWPGYTKGIVITMEDALALAVITLHRKPGGMPPLIGYLIAYMLAGLLSVFQSGVWMGSAFYPFQLLRVVILLAAVAKIASDERALTWLAMGLAAGVAYQAYFCIDQKLHGAFQTAGTMGHQNLLGLMTEFVLVLLLAILAMGSRNRVIMLGVISALVVIGLGASRGAVLFSLGGVALFMVLSIIRRPTQRKWQVVGFAALALALTSPLIIKGMNNRIGQIKQAGGNEGVDLERQAFERAAKAMFADHPMGVGANQYVVVANAQGYSKRAGVIWNWTSRAANVHNTYLLVAAETGWPGLVAFITMFAMAIIAGLRFAFANKRDPHGDVVLACTVTLITTALHIQYEWIWVLYQAQYTFAISLGIISGMIRARAIERREIRRRRLAEESGPDREFGPLPSPAG
ncbi:MAG: O-antigen ligase family protein [Sphingomonadales bacterium]|nr:O-antigen ligase family protein [Sphingomonadales bacterium]